ncbi:hypothetical protein [Herminiimonas arsenitoxidans]|nr:hypothetical protein [Herminiimonas arsenitoxidans]
MAAFHEAVIKHFYNPEQRGDRTTISKARLAATSASQLNHSGNNHV